MPGTLGHLSSRFFDVLLARPLDDAEAAIVETWLEGGLATVFFEQGPADQRHGYEAGLSILAGGGGPDAVVAAAMHDVGKRHARLGVLGRTLASVAIKLGLPLPERVVIYRDHGLVAAEELVELRAPDLAVEFARHHHGNRPASIDPHTWDLLIVADQPKTRKQLAAGITSVPE